MTIPNFPDLIGQQKLFEGTQNRFRHRSDALGCEMTFSVYLPPQTEKGSVPCLYWLSGLTCNDENFSLKSGAQRVAAELGLALIIPDTSPRGEGVAEDPEGQYDLGLGASFYVNATQEPWSNHYQMESYIVDELPRLLEASLPLQPIRAISGHSMGGHGALVLGMRHPKRFRSISAFSPIANPSACPWGIKAFRAYLGPDQDSWLAYDACHLITRGGETPPIRIDQGTADSFLKNQLFPENLLQAAQKANVLLDFNYRDGYDHSYYFIATFIEAHLRFHAQFMSAH
ncbi:MAG: S-formylglutathione hydrolase [Acidobacteria bacterium]|nr:S-formylglutathione hydrolase [Acidobacteriota bacterium]